MQVYDPERSRKPLGLFKDVLPKKFVFQHVPDIEFSRFT